MYDRLVAQDKAAEREREQTQEAARSGMTRGEVGLMSFLRVLSG